jgi:hypothetical protein
MGGKIVPSGDGGFTIRGVENRRLTPAILTTPVAHRSELDSFRIVPDSAPMSGAGGFLGFTATKPTPIGLIKSQVIDRTDCFMAGAYGNRTHQEPVSRPLTGFEDRAEHQLLTRSPLWASF